MCVTLYKQFSSPKNTLAIYGCTYMGNNYYFHGNAYMCSHLLFACCFCFFSSKHNTIHHVEALHLKF